MIVIEVNISQTSLIAILCAVCGGITVFFIIINNVLPDIGPRRMEAKCTVKNVCERARGGHFGAIFVEFIGQNPYLYLSRKVLK